MPGSFGNGTSKGCEMQRREFLQKAGAIAAFTAKSPSSLSATPSALSKNGTIDAHVHVWTSDTQKYPLAAGFTNEDLWFPSFSAEEVMERGRPAGVNRFNLVQMTWYGLDHSYILDVIARYPGQFTGTGIVPAVTDVSLASPDRMMTELSKGGIYAFRIRGQSTRPKFNDGARWLEHPGYDKMFATGADHNLALSFLMLPSDLPELDRMCTKFPETPVIIDHFCLVGRNMKFIEEEINQLLKMAQHKKVMLKIGAFYAFGQKTPPYLDMLPLIERVVDAFGPERCMWESDAPLQTKNGHTLTAAVAVIDEHADFLSKSDKRKILVTTAENFFFKRQD
ncbi:MAG: amidohydrolase [Fuerstiella sp.]|nr:amidohydrolase [Fuerstiella sp.]